MVRKTNRQGVRRQSRARPQPTPEPSAKCYSESSGTSAAASKRLPVEGMQPAPEVSAAKPTLAQEESEGDHYLHMRAVGKRATVVNNEVRIILCENIKDLSNLDVLEIHGKAMLERAELPIQRMIQRHNLEGSERFGSMFQSMQALSKVMAKEHATAAGFSLKEPNIESEGLYFRSCGQGKVVSNYYRLVCGLPIVDVSDPSPDILEITGDRFEFLDMSMKAFAMQSLLHK